MAIGPQSHLLFPLILLLSLDHSVLLASEGTSSPHISEAPCASDLEATAVHSLSAFCAHGKATSQLCPSLVQALTQRAVPCDHQNHAGHWG